MPGGFVPVRLVRPDSTAGLLISTIPTTHNPDQPPGELNFTIHMASGPNTVHLGWRATCGEHYTILAKAPGSEEFEAVTDTTDKQWIGLALAAREREFKDFATNAHGTGATSEVVTIPVANAIAA